MATASGGPINQPTYLTSWDAFQTVFGGFISQGPTSYLAPAVYGFFLNGGTACYIVRASTGKTATVNLMTRQGASKPDLVATGGNGLFYCFAQ